MQKTPNRASRISSTSAGGRQFSPGTQEGSVGEIFLTERELAARHQRSVKTLRNARVKGGFIPFVRIGRNVRYRFSDVLAYEAANSVGSTSEPTANMASVAACHAYADVGGRSQ